MREQRGGHLTTCEGDITLVHHHEVNTQNIQCHVRRLLKSTVHRQLAHRCNYKKHGKTKKS